jgi:hypothetical protein
MPGHDPVRELMNGLIACDDQPDEERMMELRKALEHKVLGMKRNGRLAQYVFFAGIAAVALGVALIVVADDGYQGITWLLRTGFAILITGAVTIVSGAIGLFVFRGFGYVWARHDLHDAAILELASQVQRISQRIDASEKSNSPAP